MTISRGLCLFVVMFHLRDLTVRHSHQDEMDAEGGHLTVITEPIIDQFLITTLKLLEVIV